MKGEDKAQLARVFSVPRELPTDYEAWGSSGDY